MRTLGVLLIDQGDFGEGRTLCTEALESYRRLHDGSDHVDLIHMFVVIGQVLSKSDELEEARESYEEALHTHIRVNNLKGYDRKITTALFGLGELLEQTGNLHESERYFRRCLIMQRGLEDDVGVEGVATTARRLAYVLYEQGKLDESEILYRYFFAMWYKDFGKNYDCTELAHALRGFGGVLMKKGSLVEAERLYRRSIRMRERLFGNDFKASASYLYELACGAVEKGERKPAERLFRESFRMSRKKSGISVLDDHNYCTNVAVALHFLAQSLYDAGKRKVAGRVLLESLHMYALSDEHEEGNERVEAVADFVNENFSSGELLDLYRGCIELDRGIFDEGQDHPELAVILRRIGRVEYSNGNFEEGERSVREDWRCGVG